jgi:crotonobetaine/carnitine-CoA ligase
MITSDRTRWTLPQVLCRQAEMLPERPFLHMIGEGKATRREAYDAALRIAAGLQSLGVTPGQAVAVMSPTSLPAVYAWLGINLAGAVEVNVNGAYKGLTLEHALNTIAAGTIFIEHRHLADLAAVEDHLPHLRRAIYFRLADAPDTVPPAFQQIELIPYEQVAGHAPITVMPEVGRTDIASMIYTSGTSGPAKAVRMPHGQIYFLALRTVEKLRIGPDDVFYCFHPLFHMAGKFMGILAMLMVGGSIVLDRAFKPDTWVSRIREHGATVGLAHGPMLEMIFAQRERPDDADHALKRMIMVPFPRAIAAAFERRFGLRGIECWGMTEINAVCWSSLDEPLRPGSCGKVDADWYEFRVVDPDTDEELPVGQIGEFAVRPKVPWIIMQGYHGMPDKTVQAWRNLWFHTGDSGYADRDGYVYFVDRLGDRIRRRAENISSYDIEVAALSHPAVAECAAVGVPSEFDADDDIMLCVVRARDAVLEAHDLLTHLAPLLPYYMVPRYITFIDALPRTPTNKVQKAKLRKMPRGADIWDRKAANISLRDLAQSTSGAVARHDG